MKKLLKFVLVLTMCAIMMPVTVLASGSGSVTVTSGTAKAGQTVSVDVSITGNPGVAALIVEPEYDPNVLTLDSITGSGLNWTTGNAASWSDAANTTYIGKILTLNFTVNENATYGTTSVGVKIDASNYDEELVSFSVSSGTVTIECNHVYGQGSVTTAATCEGAGVMTYECTLGCGKSYTESIPATGHAYGEWKVIKEATCTEAGTEKRVCANDEKHVEEREIDATGHAYGEWKVIKEATCTEAGTEKRVCANDETHVEEREVDATGHAYGEWKVTREATCTEAGKESRVCANDETHVEEREVDATGHAYGEWKVTKEATCTEAGKESRICANDKNHVEIRKIAIKAHNYNWVIDKEATTEATGLKHEECTVCGTKRNEGTVIPKEMVQEEHTHVYGYMDMDATYHWVYCACSEIGSKGEHNFVDAVEGRVRCVDCGYETAKSASAPSTGDSSNLTLWFALMAVAAGAVSVVVYNKKKRM